MADEVIKMRRAFFMVGPEQLLVLAVGKYEVVENPLPTDVQFRGANFDFVRQVFVVCVESESFEEVEEGKMLPEVAPPLIRRCED